ncbi:MAG: TIM barrel protein [Verrucomicrobiales bacterium]|nr:TIM barrel protein [Verrucomicrobiales bacterium]
MNTDPSQSSLTRRALVKTAVASASLSLPIVAEGAEESPVHIATNTYPWLTFAKRKGEAITLHADELLGSIASTGVTGYEPVIGKPEEFDLLGDRLKSHELEMRSIYVVSTLHEKVAAAESIESVLAIGQRAVEAGVKIIVTNPSPVAWGQPNGKSDDDLKIQSEAMDQLGEKLGKIGLTLAYHNHDVELELGAREFHHMLTATNPEYVKFCLDAHWVFRGCGDSQVALFDVVSHYHERIVELHLRQSVGGIWTEVFSLEGDIDYRRLFRFLAEKQIVPHLVLEQAVEAKTPETLDVVAAHRESAANLSAAFQR